MSKTRTILRYCLVTLLLCSAGLTVYLWPYRPVLLVKRDFQKMEMEGIDRLDEEKRMLMTSYMKSDQIGSFMISSGRMHGYNTNTGECTWNQPKPRSAYPFQSKLSDSLERRWSVSFNQTDDTLQIFESENRKLLKSIPTPELPQNPHHFETGFSRNDKLLWIRMGRTVRLFETNTFSMIHEMVLESKFIALDPNIAYLRDGVAIDISDDGKLLTIADRNMGDVAVVDLTTKQQHAIPKANMAKILADQRTVLAFKMNEQGAIARPPVYHRLGTAGQWETVPHLKSDSCSEHFLCMNDRFFVTFQKPASVSQSTFFWKWIPDSYRAKLADILGLLQFKVPFTVWSAESGDVLHRFTLSLPGTMEPNGSHSFNRVNAHADVISSDGTLLGLSDTASLSLWNIPPRRHWSCWVVTGSFVLLAVWCGWRRRVKVSAKPQG